MNKTVGLFISIYLSIYSVPVNLYFTLPLCSSLSISFSHVLFLFLTFSLFFSPPISNYLSIYLSIYLSHSLFINIAHYISIGLFNHDMATCLGEGKLNPTQLWTWWKMGSVRLFLLKTCFMSSPLHPTKPVYGMSYCVSSSENCLDALSSNSGQDYLPPLRVNRLRKVMSHLFYPPATDK